ncbi:hypothetical protein TRFO_15877 [Tritrichomonas foetus]|uniref:DUF3447 domain-containing protein n=1 Tax=Tritrichomonas foetus TaxID=1144522 RepID=A0A1J4KRH8_9EUKA|nr:hypothetical protein TRFO_15861 [Tritrichomonas foetus]OHT13859.1 hypothetical protein TRFO_15877 [Tritrichomonas foetus]|eukprot:OHT13854.1 hypothetical protein TRFO_15861 [Tritrichomonas foetus]
MEFLIDIYYTPLHKASSGGYYETAELLLKQPNIDINSKDKIFIYHSLFFSIFEMEFLIDVYYTPLYEACYGGYYEIVELLLKQPNIDINSKDKIFIFQFIILFYF